MWKFLCRRAADLLAKAQSTTNHAIWRHARQRFARQKHRQSSYQALEHRGSWGMKESQSEHKKIKKLFSPRKARCNMPKASIFDFFYNSRFCHSNTYIDFPQLSGICQPLDRPLLARTENICGRHCAWVCEHFASQLCTFGIDGCFDQHAGLGPT